MTGVAGVVADAIVVAAFKWGDAEVAEALKLVRDREDGGGDLRWGDCRGDEGVEDIVGGVRTPRRSFGTKWRLLILLSHSNPLRAHRRQGC